MKRVTFAAAVLICSSFSMVGTASAAPKPVTLLTADEASTPDSPAANPSKKDTNLIGRGSSSTAPVPVEGAPQIVVDTPSAEAVAAPFPVKIRFIPADGAQIDLASLKIDVLKLVNISLLSRVKPYLTPAGIFVPEAKIPSGNYTVRIVVSDTRGREGSIQQVWNVK